MFNYPDEKLKHPLLDKLFKLMNKYNAKIGTDASGELWGFNIKEETYYLCDIPWPEELIEVKDLADRKF